MREPEQEVAMSRRVQLILAATWLLLTTPLLNLGYGSDVDAWLVANRALQIWSTRSYARSRSTGFPLYELVVTPFVHVGGWIAANAIALVAGMVMLFLLTRLAERGALRS